MRTRRGEGGAEVEGTCATRGEAQVGAGSPGLRAGLRYGMPPPVGNQRPSALRGWVGPGRKTGESWFDNERKRIAFAVEKRDIISNSFSDYVTKTYW